MNMNRSLSVYISHFYVFFFVLGVYFYIETFSLTSMQKMHAIYFIYFPVANSVKLLVCSEVFLLKEY